MSHYIATIKVIVEADNYIDARFKIEAAFTMAAEWGYVKTGENSRAFPKEISTEKVVELLSLKESADEEVESTGYPALDEYEEFFDKL